VALGFCITIAFCLLAYIHHTVAVIILAAATMITAVYPATGPGSKKSNGTHIDN
jgi:hypothetical protein